MVTNFSSILIKYDIYIHTLFIKIWHDVKTDMMWWAINYQNLWKYSNILIFELIRAPNIFKKKKRSHTITKSPCKRELVVSIRKAFKVSLKKNWSLRIKTVDQSQPPELYSQSFSRVVLSSFFLVLDRFYICLCIWNTLFMETEKPINFVVFNRTKLKPKVVYWYEL